MCVCERVVVGVCVSVGHESFKRKGGESGGRVSEGEGEERRVSEGERGGRRERERCVPVVYSIPPAS